MRLHNRLIWLVALIAGPSAAHDSTRVLSEPNAADVEAARSISDAVIQQLEMGNPEEAVEIIKKSAGLWRDKSSEISVLLGQFRNAENIYGKLSSCVLSEYEHNSAYRLEFRYVCQHPEILIQWTLRTDKLPAGWAITNFRFSDQF